jgi:hypothetical protein
MTTLAKTPCHHAQARERFDDGILWVEFGQEPNVANVIAELYHMPRH